MTLTACPFNLAPRSNSRATAVLPLYGEIRHYITLLAALWQQRRWITLIGLVQYHSGETSSNILVINQLDAQNLFYNKFIIFLYMFRTLLCSSSGVQNCIIQHLVSSHCVGGRPVRRLKEDCAPDGHLQVWRYQMVYNIILTPWWRAQQCSKHVEAYNKLIIKQDFEHQVR